MDPKERALQPREAAPPEVRWNLGSLFPNREAWEAERRALAASLEGLRRWRGQLREGPDRAREALGAFFAARLRLERLHHYAHRLQDEDLTRPEPAAMVEAVNRLAAELEAAAAYLKPELLRLPDAVLAEWEERPELADYNRFLARLRRLRGHILSPSEERLLAHASPLGPAFYQAYSVFADAELIRPRIRTAAGEEVVLTPTAYRLLRQSPDREERRRTFEAFWGGYAAYRRTLAQLLNGELQFNLFLARSRNYPDVLTMALEENELPIRFYGQLLDTVAAELPRFHRYLELRRRLLGIRGEQYYYDLYPPLAPPSRRRYPFPLCRELALAALAPLGAVYRDRLAEALKPGSGWLDLYPNRGKRSGAYMAAVYGHHPHLLLNHTDDFESLTTLVHELGHALHSVFSQEHQPYPKAAYSIFTAEVASTLNEILLYEYLLAREKDPGERRFLLSEYLNGFRGTVFRQILFAEFERRIYALAAEEGGVTADALCALYLDLLRRYHGHDRGVMHIHDLYGVEWAYIPHFYYRFYVYQYTSSYIAATALAEQILAEGETAARRYREEVLSAGGSAPPLALLRRAGVDLESPEPYRIAFEKFTRRMEELESLGAGGC